MIKQNFILAQNEKVVPIVSTMLEALEFTQTACVSNVFEYSQGQYHLNSWVEICKRPISFWCTYDSLLIVLDEEKEIEELPLPLRVLIAYGEIFKQPIKIIQSDGRLFKRKKKRLYWEDSDVQSYIKDAKIRRQAFTQNMKCLHLDPEYGDLIFGDECYDAIDIPFELAKRLSSWFALCYEVDHFNYEYSPAELAKLEDQIDHEEKYLIDELQKVLPHVVIS